MKALGIWEIFCMAASKRLGAKVTVSETRTNLDTFEPYRNIYVNGGKVLMWPAIKWPTKMSEEQVMEEMITIIRNEMEELKPLTPDEVRRERKRYEEEKLTEFRASFEEKKGKFVKMINKSLVKGNRSFLLRMFPVAEVDVHYLITCLKELYVGWDIHMDYDYIGPNMVVKFTEPEPEAEENDVADEEDCGCTGPYGCICYTRR